MPMIQQRWKNIAAKHRKMHLNDSAVTDSCKFVESDFFTGGDMFTIFDTEYCKFGIGI